MPTLFIQLSLETEKKTKQKIKVTLVNCPWTLPRLESGPAADPPGIRGGNLELTALERGRQMPVSGSQGPRVTAEFGRLTSFLTLRVSYFKHEGLTLERKGKEKHAQV